ncbi:vitellogenin-2-like, partial [Ochlerotatus camptorhynchus]|uniref:vitellogenin-2-like n=1 Tax=Ochlerotatus camptorhynchus TaxID=644619 RepID=UPI0031DBCA4C
HTVYVFRRLTCSGSSRITAGFEYSIETFTIEVFQLEKRNFTIGVAIRCEETDMYLCFDKNWKIKGMKNKNNIANRPRCHFYESLKRGYFRYQSVMNQTKYLGFVGSGKPINYKAKRHIDEKCYNFQRTNASALPSVFFGYNNSSRSASTTKSPHPHRHKHGMSDQKRTRGKFNSHRTQNLADQGASSSQLPPSTNNVERPTRLITSSVPSYRVAAVTQMSNDVHTTTQKPSKVASTKKQVKPSKRHGKTNRQKLSLYGSSNSTSSSSSSTRQHHRHHHDNRNSKLGSGRTMPTASSF